MVLVDNNFVLDNYGASLKKKILGWAQHCNYGWFGLPQGILGPSFSLPLCMHGDCAQSQGNLVPLTSRHVKVDGHERSKISTLQAIGPSKVYSLP